MNKHNQSGWKPKDKFLLHWVLANCIGVGIGYFLLYWILIFSGIIGSPLPPVDRELKVIIADTVNNILKTLPLFLSITFAQWVVLKSRLENAIWWIPMSLLGYAIAMMLISVTAPKVFMNVYDPMFSLTPGLFLGIGSGLSQWVVLRKNVDQAVLWVFISLFVFCLSALSFNYLDSRFWITKFAGWILGSSISGVWFKSKFWHS